jgi:hypothetical protein
VSECKRGHWIVVYGTKPHKHGIHNGFGVYGVVNCLADKRMVKVWLLSVHPDIVRAHSKSTHKSNIGVCFGSGYVCRSNRCSNVSSAAGYFDKSCGWIWNGPKCKSLDLWCAAPVVFVTYHFNSVTDYEFLEHEGTCTNRFLSKGVIAHC